MRSPLTELYQKVSALAEQIHAMPEDERNFLFDLLLPESEPMTKLKKTRKKRGTKSARASSLQQQIAGSATAHRRCSVQVDGQDCYEPPEAPVHWKESGLAGYHEFQPPQKAAATGD